MIIANKTSIEDGSHAYCDFINSDESNKIEYSVCNDILRRK